MDLISLQKVDESNFIACFALQLHSWQEKFVSHPIRSLAQAYVYYKQCTPFAVCLGSEVVGYVMVIYDYDAPEYDIWHMMIDAAWQGRGYGEAALREVLSYIRTKPFGSSDRVALTCHRENRPALALYEKLGFHPTGEADEDELEYALNLEK